MASFNQQELAYKVLSANQCSIFVGTQLIGFGQSSSPSIDYGTDAFYGCGTSLPQEIQQLRMSMTITLDTLKLTAEGQAFFGESKPLSYILANNSFDIYVVGTNQEPIYAYVGCVASNQGAQFSANSAVAENVSFIAMDVLDNTGTSIMNGQNALGGINFAASSAGGAATPTAA